MSDEGLSMSEVLTQMHFVAMNDYVAVGGISALSKTDRASAALVKNGNDINAYLRLFSWCEVDTVW